MQQLDQMAELKIEVTVRTNNEICDRASGARPVYSGCVLLPRKLFQTNPCLAGKGPTATMGENAVNAVCRNTPPATCHLVTYDVCDISIYKRDTSLYSWQCCQDSHVVSQFCVSSDARVAYTVLLAVLFCGIYHCGTRMLAPLELNICWRKGNRKVMFSLSRIYRRLVVQPNHGDAGHHAADTEEALSFERLTILLCVLQKRRLTGTPWLIYVLRGNTKKREKKN